MGKLAEIAPLQGFLEIGAAVPGPALARHAHQLDPGFENHGPTGRFDSRDAKTLRPGTSVWLMTADFYIKGPTDQRINCTRLMRASLDLGAALPLFPVRLGHLEEMEIVHCCRHHKRLRKS